MRPFLAAAIIVFIGLVAACGSNGVNTPAATTTPAEEATPTPEPVPTEAPEPRAVDAQSLLTELDTDGMLEYARVLAVDIGIRVAGTDAELAAAEYVAAQFESYGYEVSIEPFTFAGDRFAPGSVIIGETTIEAFSLIGSIAGEVSGRLVYAGLGTPDDLAGLDVEGAVVVVDRGEIPFGEKYRTAADMGAAGLVVVNTEALPLIGANLGLDASFPVAGVSLADRDTLLLAAGSTLEATVVAQDGTGSSWNVVARAPGTERCLVLAGGHHDTVPASPGGNDNASGMAHVLELARVTALDMPLPGVCFASFGAEESGLHGSRVIAASMTAEGMLPEYMLNFDVTGLSPPVEAIGTEALVGRALALGVAEGVDIVRSSMPPNVGSDHMSFADRGVPVVFFATGLYDEIHTPADTFDLLERDGMEATAIAGLVLLLDLYVEVAGAD